MSDRPRRDAKEVFLEAIEKHAPEEWDAYVEDACGTDASLRGHVEGLLRAHREEDSVFDRGASLLPGGLSGLSQILLPEVPDGDSPPPTARLRFAGEPPPDLVGRYRIEAEIARGGVGAVYKAHDDDLGRSIAVKLLLDEHRRNPEMLQRFMEEAQISGQLQHPGIVPVHDVGLYAAEKPYFAMKLIRGQTLAKVLDEREDRVGDRQMFLAMFEKICETIAYAHARGVIHRDLKPSNVMIGSFGEVQVVDWGLAKVLARGGIADNRVGSAVSRTAIATVRSGSSTSNSLAGSVLGTPAYMSPEQARGEIEKLDERSDVFGLGAILCEILTGTPPYVADTARALLNQASKGYLEDAWARLDACGADGELIDLVKRCLAAEPRDRPREAGSVAKEVRGYLESLEERARLMTIQAGKARLRLGVALTIVIALSLGGGAMVWLARERTERAEQASAAVASVVSEARELAAAASAGQETDGAAWIPALDALKRADSLVTDEVDEETLRSLEHEKSNIEAELRKRRFRSRLETLRDSFTAETIAHRELESRYADVIREFLGRDVEEMPADDAVDLIRASGMREELAQAVEEWALVRSQVGKDRGGLIDLAIASDPKPYRIRGDQLLTSTEHFDVERFLSSDDAGQAPVAYLVFFARALVFKKEFATAEAALRRALRKEPGGFRANFDLCRLLRQERQFREALHYAFVAMSLRPDDPSIWGSLGRLLEDAQDLDGALDAYTQLTVLGSDYEPLRKLLETEQAKFGRDVFERTVSTLTRLATSEERAHRVAREVLGLAVSRLLPAEAESYLDLALEGVKVTHRRDLCAFLFLARVQFTIGRSTEAIHTLEEAVRLPFESAESDRARALLEEYRDAAGRR